MYGSVRKGVERRRQCLRKKKQDSGFLYFRHFVEGKEFQMWNGFYESDDDGYLCRSESCWDDIDTSEVFSMTFGDYGIMDKPEYYFRIKE